MTVSPVEVKSVATSYTEDGKMYRLFARFSDETIRSSLPGWGGFLKERGYGLTS
jgi:hypothetical protein